MDELFKKKINFIVGPTGVGKSAFALEKALKNDAIIINGDSLQVYKDLDIGTAKPSLEERGLCPHYLFDIVPLGGHFTAGQYRKKALEVIEANNKEAFIVGGSGFYLQALEKGMFEVGPISEEVQNKVDESILKWKGLPEAEALKKSLSEVDPVSSEKISLNDTYRLRRALEVSISEGRAFSEIEKDFREKTRPLGEVYSVKKIGLKLEREELRKRIKERTQKMLKDGFVEEVRKLLVCGLKSWAPLKSVGYKEVCLFLDGQISEAELSNEIVAASMKLAKKQMTWFKRDREIEWLDPHKAMSS